MGKAITLNGKIRLAESLENPFQCNWCNYVSWRKGNLKNHNIKLCSFEESQHKVVFNERSGDLRSVTWANKGWRGDRWNSLGLLGHYVHLPIIELKVANRIILDICDILFIYQASTTYFSAQNRVGINNASISKNICRDELTDGWKKAFDTNGNVEACSSQGLARRIKRN